MLHSGPGPAKKRAGRQQCQAAELYDFVRRLRGVPCLYKVPPVGVFATVAASGRSEPWPRRPHGVP